MIQSGIFRSGIFHSSIFGGGSVAPAIPWWLSGGIAAASCLAAYTPKGALNLAASYDNNAAPANGLPDGTYDAAPGVAPTWDAVNGWTLAGAQYLVSALQSDTKPTTIIARITHTGAASVRTILGGAASPGSTQLRLSATHVPTLVKQDLAVIGTSTGAAAAGGAVVAVTYSAVGAWAFYIDGVAAGSGVNNVALVGGNTEIGRRQGPLQYFVGTMLALAKYSTDLTGVQVAAVSAAMAAL